VGEYVKRALSFNFYTNSDTPFLRHSDTHNFRAGWIKEEKIRSHITLLTKREGGSYEGDY